MSLGQVLRDKRLALGKSLEQISAATRIHVRILSALEEDRYSELPARTFTRGFITSYAKALRLDVDQLLKEHHEFLEKKFTERQDRDQGHQGYVFEGKELEQNKRGMIIGASVAIFFAIAVLLIFKPQNHKRKEKHKDFTAEDVASSTPNEDGENEEVITTDGSSTPRPSASVSAVTSATASSSASASATVAAMAGAVSTQAPSPMASVAVVATATPTAAPKATVTPKPTAKPTATPSPKPSASPSATPATDEVKKDPLNKGDELGPKEFKKKIAFEALDDVYVKYTVDGKPQMQFNLRKGRFLVIKAKTTIIFEVNKPESLQYRVNKIREYKIVPKNRFSIADDGSLVEP